MIEWQSTGDLAFMAAVATALLMLSLPLIPVARDGWNRLWERRRT